MKIKLEVVIDTSTGTYDAKFFNEQDRSGTQEISNEDVLKTAKLTIKVMEDLIKKDKLKPNIIDDEQNIDFSKLN